MAIITRAGTAALQPEQVAKPAPPNRHPQDGRFIRKGSAPVKRSTRKHRTLSAKETAK